MSVHLSALAVKGRSIATVAAVLVAAMVVITGQAEAVGVSGTPLLAQGAGMGARPSTQVRQVQRALEHRGYDLGDRGVDGRFGPLTAAAVRRLQAQRGLAVDGIVGTHTRTALRLSRRAAASAPSRRTHAERSAAASTRRESTRSQPVIAPAATRPNTTATARTARPTSSARSWGGASSRPLWRSPWPGCGVGCRVCAERARTRHTHPRTCRRCRRTGQSTGSHRRSSRPTTPPRCRRTGQSTGTRRRRSRPVSP